MVGRNVELALLDRLVGQAVESTPFVLVEGEPGIGKSRLLAEFVRAAGWGGPAIYPRAARQGVVLAIDDVDRAGEASVDMLCQLLSSPSVSGFVVVLTHRPGRCPPRLIVALAQHSDRVHRFRLRPLGTADVDALFPAAPPHRRRLLFEASGGNPGYLDVLARMSDAVIAEAPWTTSAVGGDAFLPVDGAFAVDLAPLGAEERLVAQAASVFGRPVELGLVAVVAQRGEGEVAAAIDALAATDLVRHEGGTFMFRHPLVRVAVQRTAGGGWLLRAHQRAADWLRQRGAHPAIQAPHLETTAALGDHDAVETLVAAAGTTMDTAPEASVRWLHTALRALPDLPAYTQRRAVLRVDLARALLLSGRLTQARAELRDLRGMARPVRTAAVRLLSEIGSLLGEPTEARALVRAELAEAADATERRALEVAIASTEFLAGRWGEASELLAATGGPHETGVAVLRALCAVAAGPHRDASVRVARARTMVDHLDDGSLRDTLGVLVPLVWAELMLDEVDDAARHLGRGTRLAYDCGRVHIAAQLHPLWSVMYVRTGRLVDAIRAAEVGEESARHLGSAEMATFATAVKLAPMWWVSGPGGAAGTMDALGRAEPLGSWWHHVVATVSAADAMSGRWPLRWRHAGAPPHLLAPAWYATLAQSDLTSGDLAGARHWLRRAGSGAPAQLGLVAHTYARLDLAEGRPEAAVGRARTAVALFVRAAHPVREGLARMTLADALARNHDADLAWRELGVAKEILAGTGASWLVAQVTREQRRLGARRPRKPHGGGLTGREEEIAELVAQGLSNRAIAAELHLSPRTVDAHLTRILAKLEVSSRAAVARRLAKA